jgi:hypothetical protein
MSRCPKHWQADRFLANPQLELLSFNILGLFGSPDIPADYTLPTHFWYPPVAAFYWTHFFSLPIVLSFFLFSLSFISFAASSIFAFPDPI